MQKGLAALILRRIRVGSGLEQSGDDRVEAILGSPVQRGQTVLVLRIRVGPGFEQSGDDLHIVLLDFATNSPNDVCSR